MNGSSLQKRWALTQEAFEKFLACLDTDRERAGQKYEMIRSKLIDFFTWRDCLFPEDHADETINRVIRKIDEGEEIRDPSTYVFGIARMLLLEIAKSQAREQAALSQLPQPQPVEESDSQSDRQVECLKGCLQELPPESRQLIIQYYQGESSVKINNRKKLAEMLGLQSSTLRIRAFRLREKLEACLNECLSRIEKG
jgi:RNA polymerase sigma factor (sigma-70 family)